MLNFRDEDELDSYMDDLMYWNYFYEEENESYIDKKEYDLLFPSYDEDMNSDVTITYLNK